MVLSQRLHDILKDELRAASHPYQITFVCMFPWVTIPSCLTGAVSFVPVMSWGCNPRPVYNHRTSKQIRTPMYLLIPILPYRPHYIFVDFYMHASPLGRLLALFGGAHEEGRFARAEGPNTGSPGCETDPHGPCYLRSGSHKPLIFNYDENTWWSCF